MALSSASHEKFYNTSGSGADKVTTKNLTDATAAWAAETAEGCSKYLADPILAPLIYQLQQMQDELNYLRTEISSNKDKVSMTLGTSGSTALVGDTRLPAFTANDTSVTNTTKSTAITFGNFTTTVSGKTPTYSLPITVTETTVVSSGKGAGTTTLTKTATIPLM
jgi:hypothetical protein